MASWRRMLPSLSAVEKNVTIAISETYATCQQTMMIILSLDAVWQRLSMWTKRSASLYFCVSREHRIRWSSTKPHLHWVGPLRSPAL